MEPSFIVHAPCFIWQGKAAWHFLRVPKEIGDQIKSFALPTKGFRSVPVKAVINGVEWTTSIFPEKEGSYLLPIKKSVRKDAAIKVDQMLECTLTLRI